MPTDPRFDLLHRYSEWLDSEHLLAGETDGDHRSHDDLVRTFLTEDT